MENLIAILSIIIPFVTLWLGYIFGGKLKNNAEVSVISQEAKSKEIDNMQKLLELWNNSTDRIEQDRKREAEECRIRMEGLASQNKQIIEQHDIIILQHEQLKKDHAKLQTSYNEIKKLLK